MELKRNPAMESRLNIEGALSDRGASLKRYHLGVNRELNTRARLSSKLEQ